MVDEMRRVACFFKMLCALHAVALGQGRIAVEGYDSVDFGTYPAGEQKTAAYIIRNTGNNPLEIIQIRKTCGCASAICDRKNLAPGETGRVDVFILPNSIFGSYSKNTFVESSDPDCRFLRLNVTGNAVPLVEITPSTFFNIGRIKLEEEGRCEFGLKPNEHGVELGEPLIESKVPIQVRLGPKDKVDARRLLVSIPAQQKSSDLQCRLTIPVLSPTNNMPLEIHILGAIGQELTIIPSVAYLTFANEPQTRQFVFKIPGQKSRKLDPTELILPDRKDIRTKVEYDPTRNILKVTVEFSAEFLKILYTEERIPLVFGINGAASTMLICKLK